METKIAIDQQGITGNVIVTMPTFKERMQLMKAFQFKMDSDGQVSLNKESLDFAYIGESSFDLCVEKVKSMELVHAETGTFICSINELSMYQEGMGIIIEIATKIRNGLTLGKI